MLAQTRTPSLGKAQGLPSQALLPRPAVRGPVRVSAAAAGRGGDNTDLGAMFRDALSAPPSGSGRAAESVAKKAAAAVAEPVQSVPGTEFLEKVAAPGPEPTQGMDIVLARLREQPPAAAASRAAASAPLELPSLPSPEAASKQLAGAAGAVGDAASSAASAAADTAAGLAGALSDGVAGAAGALSGAAGGAGASVQRFLDSAAGEYSTELGIIKSNIDAAVGGATGAAAGAADAAAAALDAQLAAAAGALPPELASAGAAAAGAVSRAAHFAADNPAAAALLAGLPLLAAAAAAFAGYAGSLAPAAALEVLRSEDALLVDVRAAREREQRGVVELKRGALGKGVAVPPVTLPPALARRVRSADALALDILAAEIAGLARVRPGGTKVLVLDAGGERGVAVARALTAAGVRRAYVVKGGFRGWAAAGLAVRSGSAEYYTNALDAVGDAVESVGEEVAQQATALSKDPPRAAVVGAGVAGAALVAFKFHTALQFVGVLGLELSLAARVLQYESLGDALDDVAGVYRAAANLAGAPTRALAALGGGQQRQEGRQ